MATILIKNLTFGYNTTVGNIFDKVHLRIDTDWRLGLVGRNGKGKTTLFKLLLGQLEYEGRINTHMQFEYFPYSIRDGEMIVNDIISEIAPDAERWRITKELALLNINDEIYYRIYNTLSKGEQTKVMLAILFSRENTYLLIDEPTNHLDIDGRHVLSEYLKKKSSYIIISHDRTFLDNAVDHIMSINKANIEIQKGSFSSYLNNKRMQDEYELVENDKLNTEISRLSEASKRATVWADKVEATKFGGKQDSGLRPDRGHIGAQSAKMMSRAKAIQGRIATSIEEKSKLLTNVDRDIDISVISERYHSDCLIWAKDLVINYDGVIITQPLSFEILQGDRVALIGGNGSGKTSLINAITGAYSGYDGELKVGSRLKISYVNQDTSQMSGNIDDFCCEHSVDKTRVLSMLSKMGLDKIEFDKPIDHFSEGQKKKLLIAKSLSENAHIYIWDEPLNYIDVISREQIERLILQCRPTMLFVEHDARFCDTVATKKIHLQ